MPAMKKVYNPIPDFFIPEKRCCFWVGVVMQTVEPSVRKQHNTKAYIYVAILAKITESTLDQ
jgi:hypothetical protein